MTRQTCDLFLERAGLDAAGGSVEPLGGGVSSAVFVVRAKAGDWVVKQPMPRFRVADEWVVDVRRVEVEFRFADLAWRTLGPVVPKPLFLDREANVIVMAAAPRDHEPWKARLMQGRHESTVAGAAGDLLARIHGLPAEGFVEEKLFHQQRIEPYFIACARRHPSLAHALRDLASRLDSARTSLVHGDYSPKNILTDGRRILLVDHEVVTTSDPRFDVAFLVNHLVLKAFAGRDAQALQGSADEFLYRYVRARGPAVLDEEAGAILAALMLARVDGKSPAEYLSGRQQDAVRAFALESLAGPVALEDLVTRAFARFTA